MKTLILISLLLTGCGSESKLTETAPPTPAPVVEVKKEEPKPDLAIVGNWIDGDHKLAINGDYTAISDDEDLTWSLDENKIKFLSGVIQIDACMYQIESVGGIQSDLIVTLKLYCDKSGALSYKKQ